MKLILHIGMGKTGTSAIQSFLQRENGSLKNYGVLNAGIRLQNLGSDFSLDNQGDVRHIAKLEKALEAISVAASKSSGVNSIVWSNESLSQNSNYKNVASSISKFVERSEVFDSVSVILVLRRQDLWLESAYRQWGLKHKVYSGHRIMNIQEYYERTKHLLDYLSIYRAWSQVATDGVTVVDYNSEMNKGGMVRFIADYLSIPWSDKFDRYSEVHRSLGPALSFLTAYYNSGFHGKVLPEQFGSVIKYFDLPEISAKGKGFLSSELIQEISERYAGINKELSVEAGMNVPLFSDVSAREYTPYSRGKDDVVRYLLMMAQKQQSELQELKLQLARQEERLAAYEKR